MLKSLYKRAYYLIVLLSMAMSFTNSKAHAQDFEFGTLTRQDISTHSYGTQTAAGGVVLQEFGSAYHTKTTIPYKLVHLYHVKIKILKADAFTYGNIKVSLRKWSNNVRDSIENLQAVVYSPDGAGNFNKKVCDFAGYHITEGKYDSEFSYAMPGITVGSIIEYRYELRTPNSRDFRPWLFQTELPKLQSEYQLHLPVALNYQTVLKGKHGFSKNREDKCPMHFQYCSLMVYAMDSIPAFTPEERMVNMSNYIAALYFHPVEYVYSSKQRKGILKGWGNLNADLLENEQFGRQLKNQGFFKRKLKDIIPQNTDTLTTARAIYAYIVNHVKTTATSTSVQKAFKEGKGSIIDVNLMLATALNAYGIKALPVLLSTRDHGTIDKHLADMSNFNYLVIKTRINNRDFYLDATDPLLPFGMIPDACYNNEGRVVSTVDSGYWVKMQPAYNAKINCTIDLTLKADGSISGNIKRYFLGYGAYLKRKEIKTYTTIDEYLERLKEKSGRIKILDAGVHGVDSINTTLWENYEISIPRSVHNTDDKIFFNPYLIDLLTENPLKLNERLYPIDFGPASEERFVVSLHLPQQVQIDTAPQQINWALPNNSGRFTTTFDLLNDAAVFSHMVQFNRSVYTPEEYPDLKELFNKIIQAQKADIILKRKL